MAAEDGSNHLPEGSGQARMKEERREIWKNDASPAEGRNSVKQAGPEK